MKFIHYKLTRSIPFSCLIRSLDEIVLLVAAGAMSQSSVDVDLRLKSALSLKE